MNQDPNAPATRADIAELRSEMQQMGTDLRSEMQQMGTDLRSEIQQMGTDLRSEMKEVRDQLRSEMQHGYDDLKETMRDNQTELLKAFYNYTTSTDAKLKDSETTDWGLRQRLSAVESRLTDVEKRLNTPPAA